MRRPQQALAAALLLPLLAACGGAPQASDPPTLVPTPTTEKPNGSIEAKALPLTKRGATDFVTEYIEALNSATASGAVDDVRRLDDGSCQSCRSTLAAIRRIYVDGGNIDGGAWTPEVLQALRRDDGWVVDVQIAFAPQKVARKAGADYESFDGGEGLASFIVRKTGGEWRIDEWTRAN